MRKVLATIIEFMSQEGRLFRYSLSYCFLLALLPTLIVIVMLFQNNIIDIHTILPVIYQYLPQDILEPFIEYVMSKDYHTITSMLIAFIASSYLASNSFYSFMLISANHEEFDTYGILIRMKAIVLFICFVMAISAVAIATHLLEINFFIVVGCGLLVVFYFFYRTLSFQKQPICYGLYGAVFTTVAIIIVGFLFFYIIKDFTSYQNIYGPLASLATLLLSIYVVSSIIYFGYCINIVFCSSFVKKEYKTIAYYRFGEKYIKKLQDIFYRRIK